MQLEKKILDLIKNSDPEVSELGYNMLTARLDTTNVIYWHYKIKKLRKEKDFKVNTGPKAKDLMSKFHSLVGVNLMDDGEAKGVVAFMKKHIDYISNDSINAYFENLNTTVFWNLTANSNKTVEEIHEFKKQIKALKNEHKPSE